MRCNKHFSDVSNGVGVCSSCLRERLLLVIEVQTETHRRRLIPAAEDRRSSDYKLHQKQLPPPNVFPRSVSPYVSRRKSDATRDADLSDHIRQRFFSTPQVVPTFNKKKSKFHAISKLFRSRSTKSAQPTLDPSSNSVSTPGQIADVRKNSTLRQFSLNETSAFDGRRERLIGRRDRGMSPDVRDEDSDAGSPSRSGYSHHEQYTTTPISARGSTRTIQARVKSSPARSHMASGIGICLSPLLRPSPSRHWKGVGPGSAAEAAYSGEIRSTVKPNLSTAASLHANRSRKLADIGRFYNKR